METIRNVDVNRLHDFKNHPFKVEMNTELCELMRSIEKEGVLVPLLVRTNLYGDGYEVISGHRRKEAAIWAGETTVPVVVRELDDDQAVVAMVDSNLHRENALNDFWEYVKEFSEKTFNEGAVDEILSVIDSIVGIMMMIHKYVLNLNE